MTPDEVPATPGDNASPVFNASTHMVGYVANAIWCTVGREHVRLAVTGYNARTGGNAATSLGALTGDNSTTGVGSAAIKNTFVNVAVAGNFRKATWESIEDEWKQNIPDKMEHEEIPPIRSRLAHDTRRVTLNNHGIKLRKDEPAQRIRQTGDMGRMHPSNDSFLENGPPENTLPRPHSRRRIPPSRLPWRGARSESQNNGKSRDHPRLNGIDDLRGLRESDKSRRGARERQIERERRGDIQNKRSERGRAGQSLLPHSDKSR